MFLLLLLFFLFQTISGKWIFNDDVHIDYQSTAILLIFQLFCIIVTALQKSLLYLINVFEPPIPQRSESLVVWIFWQWCSFPACHREAVLYMKDLQLKFCPQLNEPMQCLYVHLFLISGNQDVALSHSWCSKPQRSKSKQTRVVWRGNKVTLSSLVRDTCAETMKEALGNLKPRRPVGDGDVTNRAENVWEKQPLCHRWHSE